ncbi:hypothetical protein O181_104369 [Austropuccinia psidii MF-1]|uniref:Uncharacterized protein n=1 Tax=Austropuccinia psidii MF-1 TaxID=1389203 RepID=A0A9Q3JN00_9BASI|nr:hypothetical protein [Austropuccinia psidii MF-1]
MSHHGQSYGLGYSDFINAFSTAELEELLFGFSSHPSSSTSFWDWANYPHSTPPSPPALEALSTSSSLSPPLEDVPEAALAFYAFIKGSYDPQLFVPDPFNHFLGNEPCASSSIKAMKPSPFSSFILFHLDVIFTNTREC